MKAAVLQMNSGPDVAENTAILVEAVEQAAAGGADILFTPEVSNCMGASRMVQQGILSLQADDPTLRAVRDAASSAGLWVSIGSLALKTEDADGRFANRSFMIDSSGEVVATYDKIHMFDVTLSAEETYKESSSYRPGDRAAVAETPWCHVGLAICYDVRFPNLFRDLAQAGANVLIVPSAFSRPTGEAHWQTLLRARAIETGSFVIASAQTGVHGESRSGPRATFGHSLVVSPWGEVLLDAGTDPGLSFVDLELDTVTRARGKIASLTHDRPYAKP